MGQRSALNVNLNQSLYEVDAEFLSVVLGTGTIEEERLADLTDPQVISLAKGLSPAMLRLGGTRGDFLLFNETITIAGSE